MGSTVNIAWAPNYNHPLPPNHRFPMIKYDLLPQNLISQGIIQPEDILNFDVVSDEVICWTHSNAYLTQLHTQSLPEKQIRESGFPLSVELIKREIKILSGTIACIPHAINQGLAFNIAGGTHHAFYDRPEGFCLLNDQAVATNYLIKKGISKRVLIIDLDVHQGNGTASIFQNNDQVFTFSMHGDKNYPFRKEKSDLDINLADGTNDVTYLKLLKDGLTQIQGIFAPDFIFYQAGVDILKSDKLGRLDISMEGCRQRDYLVFEYARNINVPIISCMGGGYSECIDDIIEAHVNTFWVAKEIYG